MMAICHVADVRATTHGTRSGPTTSAGSARTAGLANARPTPNAKANPKIGATDVGFVARYKKIAAAVAASASIAAAAT